MVLKLHSKPTVVAAVLLMGPVILGGCTSITEWFSPTFLQSLGTTGRVANLPGEAPAVIVEVQNSTQHVIEFRLTWRDSESEIQERTRTLGSGRKFSELVICPVEEVTLGDVSNLNSSGAIVRYGTGSPLDPFVEVEAFGVLLQEGINYDCGDAVTFDVVPSSATASGFRVFAELRRSGAQTQMSGQ